MCGGLNQKEGGGEAEEKTLPLLRMKDINSGESLKVIYTLIDRVEEILFDQILQ
jgi:hypothetical protein